MKQTVADALRFPDAPRRATAPGAFMPMVHDANGRMSFLSAVPPIAIPEKAGSVMVPAVPTHIAAIECAGTPHGSVSGDDGDSKGQAVDVQMHAADGAEEDAERWRTHAPLSLPEGVGDDGGLPSTRTRHSIAKKLSLVLGAYEESHDAADRPRSQERDGMYADVPPEQHTQANTLALYVAGEAPPLSHAAQCM